MRTCCARRLRTRTSVGCDTAAAAAAPGVVAVYRDKDLAGGSGRAALRHRASEQDGTPMAEPAHPLLAVDSRAASGDPVSRRHRGDGGRWRRKDAAELIQVDYEEPAVARPPTDALEPDAPHRWRGWQRVQLTGRSATARLLMRRLRRRRTAYFDLVNNRVIERDGAARASARNTTSAPVIFGGCVVAPDVGGGFGSKIYHYAQEAIVTWAAAQGSAGRSNGPPSARKASCPTRMAATTCHPCRAGARRGQRSSSRSRCRPIANMGAYLSTFATCHPDLSLRDAARRHLTRPRRSMSRPRPCFTHTVPVDAYRGAGRPEATFLLETHRRPLRADETGARTRPNCAAAASSRPTPSPTRRRSRCSTTAATTGRRCELAAQAAGYAGFEARRREAAARGKLRGIGIATYIEACGTAPSQIRAQRPRRPLRDGALHPTGDVHPHRLAQPRTGHGQRSRSS